jgi:hypothetical protein
MSFTSINEFVKFSFLSEFIRQHTQLWNNFLSVCLMVYYHHIIILQQGALL